MPIYEYQCTHCNNQFDQLQKLSDAPITKCPKCLEETAVRLVSAAAFQLKGTGWYVTDFKDKNTDGSHKNKSKSETSGSTSSLETTPSAKSSESKSSETATKKAPSKPAIETKPPKSKQSQGETN